MVILTAFLLTVDQVANAGGFEALLVDTGAGLGLRSVCCVLPLLNVRPLVQGNAHACQPLHSQLAAVGISRQLGSVVARHCPTQTLLRWNPDMCPPAHALQPTAALCPVLTANAAGRVVNRTYGRRVALHEAGHFLVAYLLGLLPRGYTLSSLDLFLRCALPRGVLLNVQLLPVFGSGCGVRSEVAGASVQVGQLLQQGIKPGICRLCGLACEVL